MGPRGLTLPPASTTSAKAFRSAFYCDLCSKGYSRQNEYDAHESSYDHQHKKRLKEMKSMQKQAQQPTRGKEEKGPLVQIKLGAAKGSGGNGGVEARGVKKAGFKKGGFKSAFAAAEDEEQGEVKRDEEADQEDYYDPRQPTGCMPGCKRWVRAAMG